MSIINTGFPQQRLSFKAKNKAWRKRCVDWGSDKATITYNPIRKSVIHKRINYDLLNGILHMSDLESVINPELQEADFIPEKIQHYPIMNSKLNVLRGEESKRVFDFRVVVTNPTAISEIEENKKNQVFAALQNLVAESSQNEEEFNARLERLGDYFTYEWQDMKEVKSNCLLNHYVKEYSMPHMFNCGFMDAAAVGEEIYRCDIIGGEPTIERLNPEKVRIFKSGYSNKIEDADMIVIEDFWSPGKVIDHFYEYLSDKDIQALDKIPSANSSAVDSMDNVDPTKGFINTSMISDVINTSSSIDTDNLFTDSVYENLLPYDMAGNIRVCTVYWKSYRLIKKVRSFDPLTGEEIFNFYPETYVCDESLGETEEKFWINEAWEGTKIGKDIYVNMRPRVVQYNRLSNPSRCHFGIVGSIYNLNDSKPFSMVDMMKQYNYLYDAIHDRLNRLLARNWGKIIQLDLAKVPKDWSIDKWMYYAKTNGIAVVDSFKEGNIGAATGKLAGALNNASNGVVDGELGNSIQQYINILEFIKMEMADVAGISKQREGQISNRETVGGVERATLQSSHITEWIFITHDDVKKRALECFIETAKAALKGSNKKFQYILSDSSLQTIDIDGEEFSECDYGLVVDNSNQAQDLNSKLDTLAQAALQTQTLSFSSIMRLYGSASIAEKQRLIEREERNRMQQAQEAQQQAAQAEQQKAQLEMQQKQMELQMKDQMNMRDNETKILVATITASSQQEDGIEEPTYSEEAKANLKEKIREFDEKLKLDKERLAFDREKAKTDATLKEKQINKRSSTTK